jgi:hypothetical protein
MDLDNNNNSSVSSGECIILPSSPTPPVLSTETDTPKRSDSQVRLSKPESVSKINEFSTEKFYLFRF